MNEQKRREMFERLRALNPHPKTELEYSTPFELLVAVILSAQATDKGVNIATRRLFNDANTPAAAIFGEARGDGAIFEAARILSAFHERLREPTLTFNPSVALGGTDVVYDPRAFSGTAVGKTNVVPGKAVVAGDMRFLTREQLERARATMRAIVAENLPRTAARIEFEDGMPAMEPTDGNRALLAVLDRVSRDLGAGPVEAHDPSKRGAGDVSFVSGLVDALDGLGALGASEHAPGESVELEALPLLAKRAALLMHRLQ